MVDRRNTAKRRRYQREYMRSKRAAAKAQEIAAGAQKNLLDFPADPASAIAQWSKEHLLIPPSHPLEGRALELPDFGIRFLKDVFTHRETVLLVARKNGKSSIIAVLLLAYLAENGPLRCPGFRAGVVSVTKEKAAELKKLMQAICLASNLQGIRFWRSPAPGRVSSDYGEVDFLSADGSAGCASGFDLSITDEIGLLTERNRELVAGMRSAVSARNGRFIALSIWGSSPFVPEIVARRDDPGVSVHLFQSDPKAKLDDEAEWHKSNPGLASGIKSLDYMRDAARRVLHTPADQSFFRAHEMNIPAKPNIETIFSLDEWQKCKVEILPQKVGPCVVGFDLGGSRSMSALVAIWPTSGRIEAWGAFPGNPDLLDRGQADGVGDLYSRMEKQGELWTYSGRVVDVSQFLKDCAGRFASKVARSAADRYRRAETLDALDDASLRWPLEFRGTGASRVADGSFDVRAFQNLVLTKAIKHEGSLLLESAITEASVRKDPGGNPALSKSRNNGRIDALSAAVLAAGLYKRLGASRPRRKIRSAIVHAA